MALIQSHYRPDKSLKLHVDEAKEAARAILNNHSENVRRLVLDAIDHVVQFHDLGKATPTFQKYIKDPNKYQGAATEKAHTPVSFLLWMLYARRKNLRIDHTLIVGASVWKHHGDFPTLQSILDGTLYEYEDEYKISDYPINQVCTELDLELSLDTDAAEFDAEELIADNFLKNHSLADAVKLKLKALLLFSILLESDRTHLALSEVFIGTQLSPRSPVKISPEIINVFLKEKQNAVCQNADLNHYRTTLRELIMKKTSVGSGIESVTLPTGLGKTMVAAQWALKNRSMESTYKKIIVVLPYLSIIDQTVKEYYQLFKQHKPESLILESHSIADRKYTGDAAEDLAHKFNDAVDFFSETWNYEIIITTFDQFLYTLLSSKKNHLMRFHSLADALIIIDEIQALPTVLWQPLSLGLESISKYLNTKTLIMSATQPGFIKTTELAPNPKKIFHKQNRYQLLLRHRNVVGLYAFIEDCIKRIHTEKWHTKRALIVLNTRRSAKIVRDLLDDHVKCIFLSADVTPKERLQNIDKIKKNRPCLVVATQCIEAGVDIDMDFAIRDFAPLDAIVQCAGRCNRNGLKEKANIEIVKIKDLSGETYSSYIYDAILLEKTTTVLENSGGIICEKGIFPLINDYFKQLKEVKDTGREEASGWVYWEKEIDVKKMLRNNQQKYNFVVASQDTPKAGEKPLRTELLEALEITDRWKRKRKIRSLRKRLSELTISVWQTDDIDPNQIADQIGCYYFLKDNYYIPGKGFTLNGDGSDGGPIF